MTATSKAQCRVLSIPELLENIFDHADKKSNSINLLVCKRWLEICRPVLWRDLVGAGDLRRLLQVLAPFTDGFHSTSAQEYARIPQRDDWERFQQYASLVHSIVFHDNQKCIPALNLIGTMRPVFNLFPNLRSLELSVFQLDGIALFTLPNVRRFVARQLDVPTSVYYILRMPNLVYLELMADIDVNSFRQILENLPLLETVVLPLLQATPSFIQILSRHPRLRESKSYNHGLAYQHFLKFSAEEPSLEAGAFPALHTLTVAGHAAYLAELLKHPFFPSRLRGLHLETREKEPTEIIQLICATIPEACPNLKVFSFRDNFHSGDNGPIIPIDERRTITLTILEPLLYGLKLTSLRIRQTHCLNISPGDIEKLARAVPQIEHLFLNEEPVGRQPHTDLTLDILPVFAEHCQFLQALGIYIDAAKPYTQDLAVMCRFASLRSLHVGFSWITQDQIGPVALFLAQILPPDGKVYSDARKMYTSTRGWNDVSHMVPVLAQMRELVMTTGKRA